MNNDYNNSVKPQQEQGQASQQSPRDVSDISCRIYPNTSRQTVQGQPPQGFSDQHNAGYPEHPYEQQPSQQQFRQPCDPSQYNQSQYQQYQYSPPRYQPPAPLPQQPGQNYATASLICGIFSLVVCYMGPFAIVGVILGIISIVMGACAKKKGFVGEMATAGLIIGIIGTVLSGICFASCIICLNVFYSDPGAEFFYEWSDAEEFDREFRDCQWINHIYANI